jgi:dolichol-phosphate mannosyltransferase
MKTETITAGLSRPEAASGTRYAGHRVLAMFPFFNEEGKIRHMAPRLAPELVDCFLGINDGSNDGGPEILRTRGIQILDQSRSGVGACIKRAIRYGRDQGYDILVVMAGNNKDNPDEIPHLLQPILDGKADYVQGSRFLPGGASLHLPLFRLASIKLLSAFFRLYTWKKCTDLTNGFRAYRLNLFDDPRIDIEQEWLDGYELEYYIHWKAYKLGYRVVEVAVTKTYPADKKVSYTKISPISGWWQMLRPFFLLALGIKK